MSNKVKYGFKNVRIAPIIEGENGEITYETPFRLPGAVEMTLDPVGEAIVKYADDMEYVRLQNNQGYSGNLTVALITDEFATKILGQRLSDEGLLVEGADDKARPFALLCEVDGDNKARRWAFLNCSANRPSVGGATKTDSPETQDDELTFTAAIHPTLKHIRHRTTDTTPIEVYDAWYDAVTLPTFTPVVEDELPA